MVSTSKPNPNHAKAPNAAAIVQAFRAKFGEVKVTYVSERGFVMGRQWE